MRNIYAGLGNIIKNFEEVEAVELCPFCGSVDVDCAFVDGRKASQSECLECGAFEKHPYFKESYDGFSEKDEWVRKDVKE